jgi:hypothetical protein
LLLHLIEHFRPLQAELNKLAGIFLPHLMVRSHPVERPLAEVPIIDQKMDNRSRHLIRANGSKCQPILQRSINHLRHQLLL